MSRARLAPPLRKSVPTSRATYGRSHPQLDPARGPICLLIVNTFIGRTLRSPAPPALGSRQHHSPARSAFFPGTFCRHGGLAFHVRVGRNRLTSRNDRSIWEADRHLCVSCTSIVRQPAKVRALARRVSRRKPIVAVQERAILAVGTGSVITHAEMATLISMSTHVPTGVVIRVDTSRALRHGTPSHRTTAAHRPRVATWPGRSRVLAATHASPGSNCPDDLTTRQSAQSPIPTRPSQPVGPRRVAP